MVVSESTALLSPKNEHRERSFHGSTAEGSLTSQDPKLSFRGWPWVIRSTRISNKANRSLYVSTKRLPPPTPDIAFFDLMGSKTQYLGLIFNKYSMLDGFGMIRDSTHSLRTLRHHACTLGLHGGRRAWKRKETGSVASGHGQSMFRKDLSSRDSSKYTDA